MSSNPTLGRYLLVALLIACVAACSKPVTTALVPSTPKPGETGVFSPPTDFSATLTDVLNIDLKWKPGPVHADGYFVEYQNPGDSSFVILDIAPSDVTAFRHPDLAAETAFVYRVRPYFGRASRVAEILTGPALPEGKLNPEEEGPLVPQPAKPVGPQSGERLKTLSSMEKAVPTDLSGTLTVSVNVLLQWKDNAADEDGYLVEVSVDPEPTFKVCALLPPNTTSFRKIMLPAGRKCYFRVRAFFFGDATPLASVTTPSEQVVAAARNASRRLIPVGQ